ncbi:MAG: hypothetical protein LBR89_04485 [Holosporales bacterium]|jgi:hypothetical protein|nr:hypothetical protein [Holosporales bacterium]
MFDSVRRLLGELEHDVSHKDVADGLVNVIQCVYRCHIDRLQAELLDRNCACAAGEHGRPRAAGEHGHPRAADEHGHPRAAGVDGVRRDRLHQANVLANTMIRELMDVNSKYLQRLYCSIAQQSNDTLAITLKHFDDVVGILSKHHADVLYLIGGK